MRLVIQGFFGKRHKRILELIEVILIVVLLSGGIFFTEINNEKEIETTSIGDILVQQMQQEYLSFFFPSVSEKGLQSEDSNGRVLKNILFFISPLYKCTYPANSVQNEERDSQENKQHKAYIIEDVSEDMLSLLQTENGFVMDDNMEFIKNMEKSLQYNWDDYQDYDEFLHTFYTVDSVTQARQEYFQLDTLLGMDMTLKQSNDKPQILIYHTHSQEAFSDSVSGNVDTTIVGAGEMLAQILEKEYGYNVIHHTGEYDVPSRDYAYSKSLPALEKLLEENPSIEVVIDLHRDGVNENTRLVTDIQGKQTAKFMFFNGLSATKKGDISYLENPNLQENLAFSFQMQVAANEYYPGIARKNYLNAYRYNMHLRGKTLLVELGAQTNTVEEIKNAIAPLAHILDIVLSGEK